MVKIKIGLFNTKVWYDEKAFSNRAEAVYAAITHLERMLAEAIVKNEQ